MSDRGLQLISIKCPAENPKCPEKLKSFWQSLLFTNLYGWRYVSLVGELKSRHFEEVPAMRHHDVVRVIDKGVGATVECGSRYFALVPEVKLRHLEKITATCHVQCD